MANLNLSALWTAGVYQIETTDPVVGGADGISNKQAIDLGSRTNFLKQKVDFLNDHRFFRGDLSATNIDDFVNRADIGVYGQIANDNATPARGYPEQVAGSLMVLPGPYGVVQQYYPFYKPYFYKRHQGTNNGWAAWIKISSEISSSLDSSAVDVAASSAAVKSLNDSLALLAANITAVGNSAVEKIPKEWTTDSVSDSSSTKVASALAVKTAYDKAVQSQSRGFLTDNNINAYRYAHNIGVYGQGSNTNATTSNGYPEQVAGTLEVVPGPWEVMQIYHPYNKPYFWRRYQTGQDTWNNWVKVGQETAVITGYVNHGGTIPLPAGYSESQCKWFVSLRDDDTANGEWDIIESGFHRHYGQICYANGRTVVAQSWHGGSGGNTGLVNGSANFICIGVK